MSNLDFHPRAKLTDSIDISTLESMRNQGMMNKKIAESLGVSVATIQRYLPNKKVYKIGQDTRTGIIRAYQQKKQIEEIALMFSVSKTSVVRILRESGVTKDSKYAKRLTDKVKKDIVRYRDLGWNMKKISEATGFSYWAIHDYLKKLKYATAPTRLDGTPDIRAVEEEEKRDIRPFGITGKKWGQKRYQDEEAVEEEEKHESLQEQLQKLIDNGQATVNEEGAMVPVDIPKMLKVESRTTTVSSKEYTYKIDDHYIQADRFDNDPDHHMCMQIFIPKEYLRGLVSELSELADMIERGDV